MPKQRITETQGTDSEGISDDSQQKASKKDSALRAKCNHQIKDTLVFGKIQKSKK